MAKMLCGVGLLILIVNHCLAEERSKWVTHEVESQHQQGETAIQVLVPDDLDRAKTYRVLYILPVEAGDGKHWGDAPAEVQKLNLANKHQLICVYPTFSALPWYADHPSDKRLQQETYFLRDVIPFVEQQYPVQTDRDGRLLVGFSKSGWGAWSLLLRHPKMFAAAAAWDAPLMEADRQKYGMAPIFGTDENFQNYRVDKLLRHRADQLQGQPRLVLAGYGNFRGPTQQIHALLEKLGIPHLYRDGPQRQHHWQSGWLAEAVELLHETSDQHACH